MEDKLARLAKPKHFSIRPILIHVDGVKSSVEESEFFAKIIDFGQLLERTLVFCSYRVLAKNRRQEMVKNLYDDLY